MCDWDFTQKGSVEDHVEFDPVKKEITRDVTDQKRHAHNQSSKYRSNQDRLWALLLDNQSTCDVIINSKLLTNIRKCRSTLRLQTQTRDCVINEVGDMKGVGIIWFYPEGVTIVLSQFRMIVCSKWRMTHDTARFHKSGNIAHLSYNITTPQGFQCQFLQLHRDCMCIKSRIEKELMCLEPRLLII